METRYSIRLLSRGSHHVHMQEGAEDGRLDEAPFKVLNVGLAGASLGHLLALAPLLGGEYAGPFLPALLGVWGTALAVSGVNAVRGESEE